MKILLMLCVVLIFLAYGIGKDYGQRLNKTEITTLERKLSNCKTQLKLWRER